MPCYSPLTAYRGRYTNPSGKRSIVFNRSDGFVDQPVQVPCGQCVGCRLEKSRQWAIRCVNESQLHEQNCFITLTYNDDHLPHDFGLDKTAFPKFMKRLRKKYGGKKVRYFHCGEYGEKNYRPHYHACLFGFDFNDKVLFNTQNEVDLYTSDTLSSLWPYGFSTIGEVTFESAAYVARYVMKKVTGDKADEHYERVLSETGEVVQVEPEYTTMSRRPGIGKGWYDKYKSDAYPSDYIVLRGQKMQPPKYYDGLYERDDNPIKLDMRAIKKGRRRRALKRKDENTTERLAVKEKVKKAQLKQLIRPLDGD